MEKVVDLPLKCTTCLYWTAKKGDDLNKCFTLSCPAWKRNCIRAKIKNKNETT